MQLLFVVVFLIYFSHAQATFMRDPNVSRVAVCVTGQVDRWIPELHVHNLIQANKNVYFSYFFNMQFSNRFFTTVYNIEFGVPSNFTKLEFHKTLNMISELYTHNNSEVVTFKFDLPFETYKWHKVMGNESLDRIYEYTERQHIILNMYKNQKNCIDEIEEYEQQTQNKFTFIISSREDVYFFNPFNLRPALLALKNPTCGFVSKGCIQNRGVNMRMQIAGREKGIKIFGQRIAFYKNMYKTGAQIKNPEMFELYQLQEYGLDNCTLPVDKFPVTAARISPEGRVCLLEKEIQSLSKSEPRSCIPDSFFEKAHEVRCSNFKLKKPPGYVKPTSSKSSKSKSSSSSSSSKADKEKEKEKKE